MLGELADPNGGLHHLASDTAFLLGCVADRTRYAATSDGSGKYPKKRRSGSVPLDPKIRPHPRLGWGAVASRLTFPLW